MDGDEVKKDEMRSEKEGDGDRVKESGTCQEEKETPNEVTGVRGGSWDDEGDGVWVKKTGAEKKY